MSLKNELAKDTLLDIFTIKRLKDEVIMLEQKCSEISLEYGDVVDLYPPEIKEQFEEVGSRLIEIMSELKDLAKRIRDHEAYFSVLGEIDEMTQ